MIFSAIRRSCAALGPLIGRLQRSAHNSGSWRKLCSKPTEQVSGPSQAKKLGFKVPGFKPSEMDKRFLVWSGRFKSKEQIPEFVSYEMLDVAYNRMRIKACYVMIVMTIGGCIYMVVMGKRDASRHETLNNRNLKKKAELRENRQKELDIIPSEK